MNQFRFSLNLIALVVWISKKKREINFFISLKRNYKVWKGISLLMIINGAIIWRMLYNGLLHFCILFFNFLIVITHRNNRIFLNQKKSNIFFEMKSPVICSSGDWWVHANNDNCKCPPFYLLYANRIAYDILNRT